jgi:thioredoxin-like negative regulator of GroEL
MYRLLFLIPVLAIGCKNSSPDKGGGTSAACAKAKTEGAMAWIEDDYPAALACAKEKNVPLVLDLWAPWCHTCLSMKATVFTDASFKGDADRFVFASLDTDREPNAAVVAKFPLSAWPTFYVIGTDETVLARYVGSASTPQFHAFLEAGATARAGAVGADKRLLAAERALATKDFATAETELTAALAEAPADWVRRPDVLVSLISTKKNRNDYDGCMTLARQGMTQTGTTSSAADFLSIALECASERIKDDPTHAATLRQEAMTRLEALIADPKAQLSIDDRSDAMLILRETYKEVGRNPDAINLAERQRMMLDDAAAKAGAPLAAMTYNWQRAEVYVFLGRPLEVVPALEKSAADLPKEYDPRARLGWVYLHAGKYDEAATWTDQALALAYGPRKGRVLSQRAEIAQKKHDVVAEKKFREEAVKLWESLPPGQASPDSLAKAKEALAKVDAPSPATGSGSGSGT